MPRTDEAGELFFEEKDIPVDYSSFTYQDEELRKLTNFTVVDFYGQITSLDLIKEMSLIITGDVIPFSPSL